MNEQRKYGSSNHLGNVLSTISDRKIQASGTGGVVDYYLPDVRTMTDYYPFGMAMDGRTETQAGTEAYRFGFNGKEKLNEQYGEGNAYDFGARIYDSRLGRWMSLDPLMAKYSSISPYTFTLNNPIVYIDPDGRDVVFFNSNGDEVYRVKTKKVNATYVHDINSKNIANPATYGDDKIITAAQNKVSGLGWIYAPMPKIIQERTQTKENTTGEKYQQNDYVIAAQTSLFNQQKNNGDLKLYTEGGDLIPSEDVKKVPDLDPTLVKAISIQESNAGVTGVQDIMTANNPGDWGDGKLKTSYGLMKNTKMNPSNSIYYGIRLLATKGFKGGVTYDKDTGLKTYTFKGWDKATDKYNGGGVAGYAGYVEKMVKDAK